MGTEIFRFVTIRPPQQVAADPAGSVIDLGLAGSALSDSLRRFRASGARRSMVGAALKFAASADFVGSSRELDAKLRGFIAALQPLPDAGFWAGAQQAFSQTIGGSPADYVKGEPFEKSYAQIADSIVAAVILPSVSAKLRGVLVGAVKAQWLARRLAAGHPLTRSAYFSAPLVMPADIFPLPVADVSLQTQRKERVEANKAALAARQEQMTQLASDLAMYGQAADELLNVFEQMGAAPVANPSARRTAAGLTSTAPAGFLLSDAAAQSLADATKTALGKVGVATTSVDVGKSVTLLEKKSASLATQLYANTSGIGTMVRIGNGIVPQGAFDGGSSVLANTEPRDVRTPGLCPPTGDTTIHDGDVTVPSGHGDARVLGMADLLVLEQTLAPYKLGEIAHIENVLRSEVRSRKFKTEDRTEETVTTQTETTETKERDLSTDERFQLQTESQTVINENASKAAGLTIHASYGPSVDATANYNTSSSTSRQQSNQASSSYARQITSKAMDRVQTRTLTSRTVTTTHIADEINRHAFDNKGGTADIVGVYRYVDKVYSAQIVNYGTRLMLEFIVPEPAAFLRYAMASKPVDDVMLTNPDPPGYCLGDGTTFRALQASDITRANYIYWASKYGAEDVAPPPSSVIIASGSKKAPDSMPTVGDRLLSSDTVDIAIADGYLTQSAFVNIYGENQAGKHKVVFQLQEQQGVYSNPNDDRDNLYILHLQPTPTLTVTINTNGFHNYEVLVTVFCTLSIEKFQDWQLKTFASIMNAYNDLRSAYNAAVQEAKLQAADTTGIGTNPDNNRITEQAELKKGCISLLTGQRFDLFDAVTRHVMPYGYPEIYFAEAKAEGAYIQMFEQSFEWNNMVYLFYPYFWGKKDEWPTIAQLTDNDPLFRQFLQAGAARVQVPVRLGFEPTVLSYLATGELWNGEGTIINSDRDGPDPQHLSIIDELRSQTGNNNVDGVGTLTVTKNSAEVTGDGTAFSSHDENRRIIILGETYVIKSVATETAITLTTPYTGESGQDLGYATGGVLVGQPWEVMVPTDLVKLDDSLAFS